MLKGESGVFKRGPDVSIVWCVNDAYLPEVLESVQKVASAGGSDKIAI